MSDLVAKRFNMVTVHSNGETYDDMREKPNGDFCRYREANFSHKEIINSMAESDAHNHGINNELLEALERIIICAENIGGEHVTGLMDLDNSVEFARMKLNKALGQ